MEQLSGRKGTAVIAAMLRSFSSFSKLRSCCNIRRSSIGSRWKDDDEEYGSALGGALDCAAICRNFCSSSSLQRIIALCSSIFCSISSSLTFNCFSILTNNSCIFNSITPSLFIHFCSPSNTCFLTLSNSYCLSNISKWMSVRSCSAESTRCSASYNDLLSNSICFWWLMELWRFWVSYFSISAILAWINSLSWVISDSFLLLVVLISSNKSSTSFWCGWLLICDSNRDISVNSELFGESGSICVVVWLTFNSKISFGRSVSWFIAVWPERVLGNRRSTSK